MPQDAHWKVMYQAAMLELNPARLQASIDLAHSAMQRRIEELKTAGTQHNGNCAEMQEIMDAQNSLRTLERLECPISHTGNQEDGNSISGQSVMNRMCREVLTPYVQQRQPSWREAFPHASIITDPRKLAQLKAEVAKRKQGNELTKGASLDDKQESKGTPEEGRHETDCVHPCRSSRARSG